MLVNYYVQMPENPGCRPFRENRASNSLLALRLTDDMYVLWCHSHQSMLQNCAKSAENHEYSFMLASFPPQLLPFLSSPSLFFFLPLFLSFSFYLSFLVHNNWAIALKDQEKVRSDHE